MARKKPRILVVDDEPTMRAFITRVIKDAFGIAAESAASAEEGLKKIGGGAFDLILADIILPGLNGIEFLAQAKRKAPGLKAVMITGFPSSERQEQAFRLGAAYFLTKPLEIATLVKVVGELLELAPRAGGAPPVEGGAGPGPGKS